MKIFERCASLVALLGTTILVSACTTSDDGEDLARLTGTTWTAQEVMEQEVLDYPQPSLVFETAERVSGNGSCNGFFGALRREGALVFFGPLAATRRYCELEINDQETRFFSALEAGHHLSFDDGDLVLSDSKGQKLVTFEQRL